MRLTCPDCGAQYDVSDDAIPAEGRDVECSNCSHSWFQAGASSVKPDTQADQPVRRAVDASVAAILRAEAAREDQLRAQEVTQPEPASVRQVTPVENLPVAVAEPQLPAVIPARVTPAPKPDPAAEPNPRDMPSMSEINASLRARSSDRKSAPAPAAPEVVARSGFRRGFAYMLLILALLFAPYIFSDRIIATFPQADDAMAAYVSTIDSWRLALDSGVSTLGERATALTGQN